MVNKWEVHVPECSLSCALLSELWTDMWERSAEQHRVKGGQRGGLKPFALCCSNILLPDHVRTAWHGWGYIETNLHMLWLMLQPPQTCIYKLDCIMHLSCSMPPPNVSQLLRIVCISLFCLFQHGFCLHPSFPLWLTFVYHNKEVVAAQSRFFFLQLLQQCFECNNLLTQSTEHKIRP